MPPFGTKSSEIHAERGALEWRRMWPWTCAAFVKCVTGCASKEWTELHRHGKKQDGSNGPSVVRVLGKCPRTRVAVQPVSFLCRAEGASRGKRMDKGSQRDKRMLPIGATHGKMARWKPPVLHNLLLRGKVGRPTPRDASSTRAAAALQSLGAVEAR